MLPHLLHNLPVRSANRIQMSRFSSLNVQSRLLGAPKRLKWGTHNHQYNLFYPKTRYSTNTRKSVSKASQLNSVYYLFGAFGLSSVGIFLYYKYERHQHILEHDLKLNKESPAGFLQPDLEHSDTYEMGLYVQSQKELEQEELERRTPANNASRLIKLCYRVKYLTLDYVIEPICIVGRLIQLFVIFTPMLVTFPLFKISNMVVRGPPSSNGILSKILVSEDTLYNVLLWCLQTAGPSFIKLGQWAASRTDIFDEKLCSTLGQLHSNVKPHDWEYTERILCESLDVGDLSEVFTRIEKTPVGCGAIGQVHLGVLKQDQHPIAIKIIHPNVKTVVSRDLKIIKFFANAIDRIPTMEWLSLPDEADQFAFFMQLQLDFRIECCNLWKFNSQYKHNPSIKFPKYYENYTTRDVLFEEYIDNGISMEKFLSMKNILANYFAQENDETDLESTTNNKYEATTNDVTQSRQDHKMIRLYKRISDPFIDCFLDMLITYDFIHADLHPGNVILKFWDPVKKQYIKEDIINNLLQTYEECLNVPDDNQSKQRLKAQLTHILEDYDPKICLIDVGLVTELNKRNRINFIALFNALAQFDGIKAGNLMIERSRTPETAINKEEFALKTSKLMDTVKKRTFTLGSISIGDLLEQMLSMVRSHHVRMEGDFVSVVVAILLLEGIGKQLDPDLDLFARSLPMLREFGMKQEGREALLLASDGHFGSLFKIWIGLEIKNMLTTSVKELNELILTDQLSPFY